MVIFGKTIVAQLILVIAVDTGFELYQYFKGVDGTSDTILSKSVVAAIMCLAIFIHYLLAKRFRFFSANFGWVQTFINSVIFTERAI